MVRAVVFYFVKRFFTILRIYQHPLKRWIYKKFFKMVQRLSGRTQKAGHGYIVSSLCNQTAFSAGMDHYLLELKREGYCFIPPCDSLRLCTPHQETVMKAKDLASLLRSNINASPTKSYLCRLSNIPDDDLFTFYRYFTNPVYLDLAARYLQDEPLLTELKLLVSPVVLNKKPPEGSQLWHSDFDDDTNLKIFIFLDDIDEYSGPLQAINRTKSRDLMRAWHYKHGKEGVSHNDSIVPPAESSSIQTFVGQTGSVCLIDSVACLHRGSRFPTRERQILYATFNTRTSYRFPPLNWIALAPKINSLSSPLLSLDPHRRFLNRHGLNN
jgi:hypothetical protein